jgi:hypothetical protein
MPSQKQIEASRANGARSRGPVTPEGKRRSSQNARKHGLLAQQIVVGEEGHDEFENAMEEHISLLKPENNVELTIVENIVSAFWRTRRLWVIEARLMEQRIGDQRTGDDIDRLAGAFTALAASGELALLERYEARLHRMYRRSIQNLRLLREMNPPNEPGQSEEADLPNEPEPLSEAAAEELQVEDGSGIPEYLAPESELGEPPSDSPVARLAPAGLLGHAGSCGALDGVTQARSGPPPCLC